jgi:superoxide dismutase
LKNLKLNSAKQSYTICSGWAWLCVHPGGKLDVCRNANQDNPLMPGIGCGGTNPRYGCLGTCLLFALQNRRPDYIEAFSTQSIGRKFLEDMLLRI